jgi:hypothetical protein
MRFEAEKPRKLIVLQDWKWRVLMGLITFGFSSREIIQLKADSVVESKQVF